MTATAAPKPTSCFRPCRLRKGDIIERIARNGKDADEVMQSTRQGETLRGAIARLAAEGANVINFDEFVFLPVDFDYIADHKGTQPLRHYYFFEPQPMRLMRAWKMGFDFSPIASGGHTLSHRGIAMASESLSLRHYIFRNQRHALEKYGQRIFDRSEMDRGWHLNRVGQSMERFQFPHRDRLKRLDTPESRNFDKTRPEKFHYWASS